MAEFAASFRANLNNNGDSFETEFSALRDRFSAGFGDVVPLEIPGAVHYDIEQELTEEEQTRARQNIGVTESAGPVLFTAEGSFSTREAPATFTLSLSSRALFEALRSAEGRQEGLAGVFYAEGDGSKYAVPVTVSEASVMNTVFAAVFVFGPNATPLGFTVTLSDDPMTVEVPVSILKSVFDYNADVDQLVRTEPQNLRAAQQTQARANIGAGTYSKPTTGIPEADLANAVKNKIDNAATSADLTAHTGNADIHVTAMNKLIWTAKYSKPSGGIPASDLDATTQSRISGAASNADLTAHTGNADIHVTAANKISWAGKYTKPGGGIPKSDLNSSVQQTLDDAASDHGTLSAHVGDTTVHFTGSEKSTLTQAVQDLGDGLSLHTNDGDIHVTASDKTAWSAKYDLPAGGIPDTDLADKYAGAAVAGGTADRAASIPFGQVDDTSTSTAFTATVPGIAELRDGVCVFLMNGVVTSASGFTIDINGLGAKRVYQTMAAATAVTTLFNINYTMLFVYNSKRTADGCWDMYYGYNSDTNTLAYNIRTNVSAGNMNSQLYRYEILFTLPDGTLEPANNVSNKPTTYTKALTTESFNPFDPIYYYATTTAVAAGAAPSASYLYTQYSGIDLRYSFNAGSTLTANKAIYLRCTPQGDCLVKLDGNDCVVQALPSTEDGKVYIYLGKAYSTYQIWLSQNHPIYEYKGGKLKLWDGTI